MAPNGNACMPTWAQPSVDGKRVWVACNQSNEIVEVDREKWSLARRIPAGNGVYNLAVSPDGRYLVSVTSNNKTIGVFEWSSQKWTVIIHGNVLSPVAWSTIRVLCFTKTFWMNRCGASTSRQAPPNGSSIAARCWKAGYTAAGSKRMPDGSVALRLTRGGHDVFSLELHVR